MRKNYFKLSSGGETVILKFETRMMEGKLPPVLTFTYDLLRNLVLSSLAYAIESVDNSAFYITNEVLTSRHDCLYGKKQRIANGSSVYFMRTSII